MCLAQDVGCPAAIDCPKASHAADHILPRAYDSMLPAGARTAIPAPDRAPDGMDLSCENAITAPGGAVPLPSAQQAVKLQLELHDAKPQSPTSVLPATNLLDTTYHSFHGLADAYPELYQQAAAAGQPCFHACALAWLCFQHAPRCLTLTETS